MKQKPAINRLAPPRNRLEVKLMTLRISILQQSAASEKGESSSGDEQKDDADTERRRGGSGSGGPAAVTEKWTAMFEARDRAGTGRATVEVLQGVLEEVKENMLGPQRRLTRNGSDMNGGEEGGQEGYLLAFCSERLP